MTSRRYSVRRAGAFANEFVARQFHDGMVVLCGVWRSRQEHTVLFLIFLSIVDTIIILESVRLRVSVHFLSSSAPLLTT